MSAASQLDPRAPSPLVAARLQRKLSVDAAARRAGITKKKGEWLEAGRVDRFPAPEYAFVAAVLYATALGVDQDEARRLARIAVAPRRPRYPRGRIAGAAAVLLLLAAIALAVLGGFGGDAKRRQTTATPLLAPRKVEVDVLDGGGDLYYTRTVANKVGTFGYRIGRVARADRLDYASTAVYFEPGGQAYAARLARQLAVGSRPLPGGDQPRRLVVIAARPQLP